MTPLRDKRARLAIGLAALALTLVLSLWGARKRHYVTIGTRLDVAVGATATFKKGDHFRALLELDGPFGLDDFVTMELHHLGANGDEQLAEFPIRVRSSQDQVMFASRDVMQLVGNRHGEFNVVFRHRNSSLGTGSFAVAP